MTYAQIDQLLDLLHPIFIITVFPRPFQPVACTTCPAESKVAVKEIRILRPDQGAYDSDFKEHA